MSSRLSESSIFRVLGPPKSPLFHHFFQTFSENASGATFYLFFVDFGVILEPIWGSWGALFWTYFFIIFRDALLRPLFVKNDPKMAGGPPSKKCPTLPPRPVEAEPWNRKAQDWLLKRHFVFLYFSVCLSLSPFSLLLVT